MAAEIKELLRQKLTPQLLTQIDDVFEVVTKNVKTNYTMQDLLKHISLVEKIDLDQIGSHKLPGEAQWVGGVSWYIQDVEGTEKLIRDVFLPRSLEEWEAQKALQQVENTENAVAEMAMTE